jgi:alpha-L-arabinofuranosidase
MKMYRFLIQSLCSSLLALPLSSFCAAESLTTLTIQTDQPGARINPAMWGIFFEDINLGADGGLYAELIKNRSFEFPEPLMGWSKILKGAAAGNLQILERNPLTPQNPHYLQLQATKVGNGFGLTNEGFRGIGIRKGADYSFSFFARAAGEAPKAIRIELAGSNGKILGSGRVEGFNSQWKNYSLHLRAEQTESKARLNIFLESPGSLDVDIISLFPVETWKKRPGGLRADLVQLLADMKPGFLRFPGGCIVEGRTLSNRYEWKNTLGNVSERKLLINRWNEEFKHRPTPDYFQSFGLGFFEYFQLCEDIGAEPLPILNCGMACQFNSNELAPLDQLNPYIQDALDLIEFANGPVSSTWGQKRAELGHPATFNMKMLGVGNEQWGPQYVERYEKFAAALKAKYPVIQLVSSAGPDPDGDKFDFLWPKWRALNADLVDEHYYRPPSWFFSNAGRYDHYDRQGPKVFAGEYAAQSVKTGSPDNRNNWECALAEAAFMTGLERNADVVRMASYAPLFAHLEGWQWTPDLIWFDNLKSYGTPSYYVQQLFGRNRGDLVLPVIVKRPAGGSTSDHLYVTGSQDEKTCELILKVVNGAATPAETLLQINGTLKIAPEGHETILNSAGLTDENSLTTPLKVSPATNKIKAAREFKYIFKPNSFTVLRLAIKK